MRAHTPPPRGCRRRSTPACTRSPGGCRAAYRRRVENLRAHPIPVLIRQARVRIPAAAVHVFERARTIASSSPAFRRRRSANHGDRLVEPSMTNRSPRVGSRTTGRPVPEACRDADRRTSAAVPSRESRGDDRAWARRLGPRGAYREFPGGQERVSERRTHEKTREPGSPRYLGSSCHRDGLLGCARPRLVLADDAWAGPPTDTLLDAFAAVNRLLEDPALRKSRGAPGRDPPRRQPQPGLS